MGNAMLQFAKAAGARVAVTSARDDKARWCYELGADLVINYKTEDTNRAIRAFAPEGYWDASPSPDIDRALDVIAQRGRIVLMSGLKHRTTLPVGAFYTRNCTLYGFTVTDATPEELRRCSEVINAALARGALRARIADRLALSQAALAHRRM